MQLTSRLLGVVTIAAVALFQVQTGNAQATSSPSGQAITPSAIAASQAQSGPSKASEPSAPSHASPTGAESVPLAVSISRDLEQPLVDLTKALTKLLEKRAEPAKLTTTIFELLGKLGALIGTIVAGYGSYKASRKIPWFKENRELVATVVAAVSVAVLFYLLSGIVTSVLYVLIAILVLLVALALAAAHLLSFIDERYPDVRDSILASFSETSSSKSAHRLVRNNIKSLCEWLSNIIFIQGLNGEDVLTLQGSLAEGFDASIFRLDPAELLTPHWQIIDDKMLVPIATSLRLLESASKAEAEVVNIQMGMIVVRINGTLHFRKFSGEGFQILGAALLQHQAAQMKALLEKQQSIAGSVSIFKSQAF